MQALEFTALKSDLKLTDIGDPVCEAEQIRVVLKAAAFNRRDFWIQQGMYPGVKYPLIPGSDGAGLYGDRRVMIDAGIGWGPNEKVQADSFHLLGSPTQGTFAQSVCVPAENVYNIPEHLSYEEAAAMPVAGVTAYRALFVRGGAEPGDRVLITGAGGGVALMVLQFAIASGLEVYVTSGSEEKIQAAMRLGAQGGVNYKDEDWARSLKKLAAGFDVIIDSAGGAGFSQFPKLCNPGGRIVTYGGSLGYIEKLSPQIIFWKQISVLGTSMGSPNDFSDMVDFVDKHKISPVIDHVFDFEHANEALRKLATGNQFGKLILSIPA